MLKAYTAFSREWGPMEGAILVMANSVRQAKKLAWGLCLNVEEWTDQAARLSAEGDLWKLADPNLLAQDTPHAIDSPEYCQDCGHWGAGVTKDKLCGNCNQHPGQRLLNLFKD